MDNKKLQTAINSFIDQKVARLTKTHKLIICVAAAVIPIVAFYFLFYSPKADEITKLEKDIAALKTEIADAKAKAAKLDEHLALKKEIEVKFKEASLLIPDEKEIPSLLRNISAEGSNSGLEILSFVPGGESAKEFYAEIPVTISVTGTYHNVGYFLDTVSKMPRIVNLNNITFGSAHEVEGEMVLNSNLKFVTYKFTEKPAK